MTSHLRRADYDAAFFDLDGVLVDSQGALNNALVALGARAGARVSLDEAALLCTGRQAAESIDLLARRFGFVAPEDSLAFIRAHAENAMSDSLDPVRGVEAAIAALPRKRFVVSNSPLGTIHHRLAAARLTEYFSSQHFSAYEYNTWKPDPALYITAATFAGVSPGRSIVVEDSRPGVVAAARAGMTVLWYREGLLRDDHDEHPEIDNVHTITSMQDVRTLLV